MICNLTNLPIKCDINEDFYCSKDNEWIVPFIIGGSVDVNRTIYQIEYPIAINIVPNEEYEKIKSSEYSDVYDFQFEFPDEETALYFKLKFCS